MTQPRQDEAALWLAICTPPGDRTAWRSLRTLAREQHGRAFEEPLASALAHALLELPQGKQAGALHAIARSIHGDPRLAAVVQHLAAHPEPIVRRLAVVLAARWSPPVPGQLFGPLIPLLRDPGIPSGSRRCAAAVLLRSISGESDSREEAILRALVEGAGPVRAMRRLERLEKQIGLRPLLVKLRGEMAGQVQMTCPRCEIELSRAEMLDHLWIAHRLVLDDNRVKEPWGLIEDWLASMRRSPDPALMARCHSLARLVDPENGGLRLYQLILRARLPSPEAERAVVTAARERGASVCPACFALVPVPRPTPGQPLNHWHGRLSAGGYRLELGEGGLLTSLEIVTPEKTLYSGRVPHQLLTVHGATLLLAGPPVAVALLFALGLFPLEIPLVIPVLTFVALTLLAAGFTRFRWKSEKPLLDRAIDLAWVQMVPLLHADGYKSEDGEFIAGLALLSPGRGSSERRVTILEQLDGRTAEALNTHATAAGHLAAIRRLVIHDAAVRGGDPIPLVVDELTHALEGQLPLACGEALMADWEAEWWTPGNRSRLRVLLCDQAFGAGYEVSHLLEIGGAFPALGEAMGIRDVEGLNRLRLIWSQRASVPWERAGQAATVYEIAPRPEAAKVFEECSDLLLLHMDNTFSVAHEAREGVHPLQIALCGRGVALQGVLFEKMAEEIVVIEKPMETYTRHELRVDGKIFHFSFDPTPVAGRLERWFRFLFMDVLPLAPSMLNRDSPDVGARLRARGATPCPDCRRSLLLKAGEMAMALD